MKLLRLEWLKLRRYRFFAISTLVMLLLVLLLLVFFGDINAFGQQPAEDGEGKQLTPLQEDFAALGLYQMPRAYANLAYLAGYFKFFAAILVILSVTNEFTFRTARQNIIDGLSRKQFFGSKLITMLLMALGLTLLSGVATLVMALGHEQPDSASYLKGLPVLAALFTEYLLCFSLAFLLAWTLKRGAAAILLFLLYYFILENILYFVLGEDLGQFLPMQPGRSLIEEPFTRLTKVDQIIGLAHQEGFPWKAFGLSWAYLALFFTAAYQLVLRRDL